MLGLLDEAVLLPLAMLVLVRAMPVPLLAELRAKAEAASARPVSRMGALLVVGIWVALALWLLA